MILAASSAHYTSRLTIYKKLLYNKHNDINTWNGTLLCVLTKQSQHGMTKVKVSHKIFRHNLHIYNGQGNQTCTSTL